jgi:hypothetical protein
MSKKKRKKKKKKTTKTKKSQNHVKNRTGDAWVTSKPIQAQNIHRPSITQAPHPGRSGKVVSKPRPPMEEVQKKSLTAKKEKKKKKKRKKTLPIELPTVDSASHPAQSPPQSTAQHHQRTHQTRYKHDKHAYVPIKIRD